MYIKGHLRKSEEICELMFWPMALVQERLRHNCSHVLAGIRRQSCHCSYVTPSRSAQASMHTAFYPIIKGPSLDQFWPKSGIQECQHCWQTIAVSCASLCSAENAVFLQRKEDTGHMHHAKLSGEQTADRMKAHAESSFSGYAP